MNLLLSVCKPVSSSVTNFSQYLFISFLKKFCKAIEIKEHKKVTSRLTRKIFVCSKNWGKGPKMEFY